MGGQKRSVRATGNESGDRIHRCGKLHSDDVRLDVSGFQVGYHARRDLSDRIRGWDRTHEQSLQAHWHQKRPTPAKPRRRQRRGGLQGLGPVGKSQRFTWPET